MESHTEKAYAKVNLFLDILGKRDDGYHDIYTIMQLVTLYDEVEITLTHNDDINLTVKNADLGIPKEKNLAYIAAKAFYENLNKTLLRVSSRADITITKNIPAAAGLAGGSADAAAVFVFKPSAIAVAYAGLPFSPYSITSAALPSSLCAPLILPDLS